MALLFGWPMVQGISEAFHTSDGVGLDNRRRMVDEPRFWDSVRNTLLLIVTVIPLQFVLALGMGLLLRTKLRFSRFCFCLWAAPLAVSDLAAGPVWLSIFTDRGYPNPE